MDLHGMKDNQRGFYKTLTMVSGDGGNARRGILLLVVLSRGILLLLTGCVIPGT